MNINNTGELYTNVDQTTLLATASDDFAIGDDGVITMTKVADREDSYYFSGDPITFTITINNTGTLAANDLFFTDTLDANILPVNGTNYNVVTTSGIVTSSTNPITVSGINLPAGGSATITITGVIA